MSATSPTLSKSLDQFTRIFRGLLRMVLCLGLWSGPTPVLHAHEKTGRVIESNPDLREHVRHCHNNDDVEYCRNWHIHFLLWGEVQPDSSDHGSVPSRPVQKATLSEFAFASCLTGGNVGKARADSGVWPFELPSLTEYASRIVNGERALHRVPFHEYQGRVALSHDVTQLLMVVRC